MPALHVRNVPEPVLAALRERAKRHGRSMQQEMIEILNSAATTVPPGGVIAPVRLTTVHTERESTWRREETYGADGR